MTATGSLSRRRFIGGGAAAGVATALAAGTLGACASDGTTAKDDVTSGSAAIRDQTVAFRGAHQAGIVTPAQDRLVFATLDVITDDADELAALLETWTATAEALSAGRMVPGGFGGPDEPTADTGEAYGSPPAHLTVTIGYGPDLFDDRFGLAPRRPGELQALPRLPLDDLRPGISGGDVCLQACADDPLIAYNAIHNLVRQGVGVVTVRTVQTGFGRTSSTTASQATARNLMGFKDGTRNLKAEQTALTDKWLWSSGQGPTAWMQGGTYLVARKIRMLVERWDRETRQSQEDTFGRAKDTGAPLGETSEFATPDLDATTEDGPVIPADAHIRLASPVTNNGIHLLRRGYNYADGVDPRQGTLDSGLFFIAFTARPDNFTRVQRRLAGGDALNEYIRHVSSAVFACPRGLGKRETWADQLFG